jgi:spoIIIJ-associated protein
MGWSDYKAEIDAEHHHGTLYLHDDAALVKEHLSEIVDSLNHLLQLIARKENEQPLFLDVNNYRKEREGLIIELARATARKSVATKSEIALPPMNSYERRIAHMELASRPDVATESIGKGKGRYVLITPIVAGEIVRLNVVRDPAGSAAGEKEEGA